MKKLITKTVAIMISVIMIVMSLPIQASATEVCNSSNLKLRWLASSDFSTDTTGNNRTGNVQGTVTWTKQGDYDGASFSNSDIWYTVSSNLMSSGLASSVEGGAGTTIAFMAYVSNTSSSSPFFCIFNNRYGTSGYNTLFSLAGNGGIVYTNSSNTPHYGTASSVTTGWHTYVIRFYSNKSLEIFADNKRIFSETSDFYDNHTFDIPNSIKIGVNRENTAYFNGLIRDFRIYNSALDASTVHQNLLDMAEDYTGIITQGADTDFANLVNNSSYKVSFVQPSIGGANIENTSDRIYYRNILYCSNSFVVNTSKVKVNKNDTYGYVLMPTNTIVLYDGITAPVIPIKASFKTESKETGNYSYSTFAAIYLPSTPAFSLNNTWIGLNTQNCNRTTGWPSHSGSTNQLGNTNVRSGNTCQVQSYLYEIGFKNGLQMNSLPSNNPKTSIPFTFNQTGNESYTVTSAGNVYYIDITGLKSAIASAKTQAINIANNYKKYTDASYNEYKNKTNALLNFDINANLQTTLGMSNAITRINNAISTAINEYNTAYSNLTKIEIADLTYLDGTKESISYAQGETPVLPNSNVAVSNNDGTHYYLGWDKGSSKVVNDITHVAYTQSKTSNQVCMYTSEVTQVATCSKSKITKYTCLICRYSYNETGEKLPHTMQYTDNGNGTHTGICTVCHELSSQVIEQHSFTNYTNNNDANCTNNETRTSNCDQCGKVHTEEIPDSSLGHKYVSNVVAPSCTEDGYTENICSVCNDRYVVENSQNAALGHSFIETQIVCADCISEGVMQYTCTNCNEYYQEYIDINPNNHSELIFARTVEPTDTEDGFDIYYCSNLCGYWEKQNIIPCEKNADIDSYIQSYNNALETIINDFSPYTSDSVALYNEAIVNAKSDAISAIDNSNVSALENATKAIIEALSLLRIKTIRVEIALESSITIAIASYGDMVRIPITQNSKIVLENDGVAQLLCYADDDVEFVATNDTTISVTITDREIIGTKYAFLDKNMNIYKIVYSQDDSVEINELCEAPEVPFYVFSHWQQVDNSNTYIAIYNVK